MDNKPHHAVAGARRDLIGALAKSLWTIFAEHWRVDSDRPIRDSRGLVLHTAVMRPVYITVLRSGDSGVRPLAHQAAERPPKSRDIQVALEGFACAASSQEQGGTAW